MISARWAFILLLAALARADDLSSLPSAMPSSVPSSVPSASPSFEGTTISTTPAPVGRLSSAPIATLSCVTLLAVGVGALF